MLWSMHPPIFILLLLYKNRLPWHFHLEGFWLLAFGFWFLAFGNFHFHILLHILKPSSLALFFTVNEQWKSRNALRLFWHYRFLISFLQWNVHFTHDSHVSFIHRFSGSDSFVSLYLFGFPFFCFLHFVFLCLRRVPFSLKSFCCAK